MGVYLSLNTLSDEHSADFGLLVPLFELQVLKPSFSFLWLQLFIIFFSIFE